LQFLIDRLAGVLERRAAANPTAASSGMVINTMGWVEGLGYELQVHAINAFKASVGVGCVKCCIFCHFISGCILLLWKEVWMCQLNKVYTHKHIHTRTHTPKSKEID